MKKALAIFLSLAIMITFTPITGSAFAASKLKAPKVKASYVTDTSITLSWAKVKKAKSYVVYQKEGKKFVKIGKTTKKKFVVKGLEPETQYVFKARAAKKKNGKSLGKYSKALTVTTLSEDEALKQAQDETMATVETIHKVGKGKKFLPEGGLLLEVNYTADYKLDEMLESDVEADFMDSASYSERWNYVVGVISDKLGLSDDAAIQTVAGDKEGCSTFSAENCEGQQIMARNYDYEGDAVVGEVIHVPANPEKGVEYASVGVSDLSQLGLTPETALTEEGLVTGLLSPYLTKDGVNSAGVAISTLSVDENYQNKSFSGDIPDNCLYNRFVIRLVLDKAGSVKEAVDLIKNSTLTSGAGGAFHWMITDSTGKSVVVESIKGKVIVNTPDDVPNLDVDDFNTEGVNYWWAFESPEVMDAFGLTKGAVAADKKIKRTDEDFQIVTNFFLSQDAGVDYIQEYNGEGVGRYGIIFDALSQNNNPSDYKALRILEKAKFWNNCPDMVKSAQLYQDESFKQNMVYIINMDPESVAKIESYGMTVEQYVDMVAEEEAYGDLYGWRTEWSCVYNTDDLDLMLSFCEDYDSAFLFDIDW